LFQLLPAGSLCACLGSPPVGSYPPHFGEMLLRVHWAAPASAPLAFDSHRSRIFALEQSLLRGAVVGWRCDRLWRAGHWSRLVAHPIARRGMLVFVCSSLTYEDGNTPLMDCLWVRSTREHSGSTPGALWEHTVAAPLRASAWHASFPSTRAPLYCA